MRLTEYTGLLIVWGSVLLAALSLHEVQAMKTHSICGVWGCGPPTNALLAIHLSWAVAIWPPLLYVPWRFLWSTLVLKRIRRTLAAMELGGWLPLRFGNGLPGIRMPPSCKKILSGIAAALSF